VLGTFNGAGVNGAGFNSTIAGSIQARLLITATFKAAEISPPAPASPWSIDPNRTQELPPNYGT